MEPQQKRLLLIAGGVLAGIVLLISIFSVASGRNITLTIVTAPDDASLTLDGKHIKAGKVSMHRGKHTLVAARQFFDKTTKTFDTANIGADRTIYIMPAPNSPSALDFLKNHPQIQMQRESVGSADAAQSQAIISDKYPIIDKLPYATLDFRIDYQLDGNDNFSLTVTTYPIAIQSDNPSEYATQINRYKGEALDFLRNNSVDTSSVPIIYKVSQ